MARNQDKTQHVIHSHLAFESLAEEADIRRRGRAKLSAGLITKKTILLGKRFSHHIEAAYLPKVSVRWIDDKIGYGLFAEELIKAASYVGEYTGVVRRNDRRYFEPLNNYCYEYPVEDEIGRSFVIDATDGCLTRFINHSPSPNLKPVYAFHDDLYHLIFIAIKTIGIGEQLSYDYGASYWYMRDPPNTLSK